MTYYIIQFSDGTFNAGGGNSTSDITYAAPYLQFARAQDMANVFARMKGVGAFVIGEQQIEHWRKLGINRTTDD